MSDLTHGDPAAGDGCAILHRLIAAALDGDDPLDVLPDALADVPEDRRAKWETVLAAGWTPADATEPNGAVWPTLGTAVWALRQGWSFETAMRHVIDIGGDTDTIACVAGGLVGAVRGIQDIPSRWTTPLNGAVPGHPQLGGGLAELMTLALRLDGWPPFGQSAEWRAGIGPVEVAPGLWLADLRRAPDGPPDAVVISLCRTFDYITHEQRRQVYLTDDAHNLDVDTPLRDVVDTIEALHAEGRSVIVHCYGGQSRTGLVLRAWLSRTRGLSADDATAEAVRLWPHTGRWNPAFDDALDRFVSGSHAAGRA